MREERVRGIVENYLRDDPHVSYALREQRLIENGLKTDIMTYDESGAILHVVECKGSSSIGGLTRGIGQAYQYKFQSELNPDAAQAQIIFACPRDVEDRLRLLRIPDSIMTYLVSNNETILIYDPPRGRGSSEFQIPGTVYTEGFELKFVEWALKAIINLMSAEDTRLDRDDINAEMMNIAEQAGQESPLSHHYNTFITLSSLNIIDSNNFLTPKGYRLYGMLLSNREAYKNELVSYFYPNFVHIQNALIEIAKQNNENLTSISCTHNEIGEEICRLYGGEVRYFNNPRRISTMMKMSTEIGMVEMNEDGTYHLKRMVSPFLPPLEEF